MTSSAPDLPDQITRDYCIRQTARILTNAETDIADSRERDRILIIAAEWRALADIISEEDR